MRDRLIEALKKARADYAEVRYAADDATSVTYRGREVENASTEKRTGGIARACVRGGWATATFDTLDALEAMLAEACASAAMVGRERTELAGEAAAAAGEYPAAMERDFRGVALDEKLKLIERYNAAILGHHESIETSVVAYFDRFRRQHFANTRGAYYMEDRPQAGVVMVAVARDGSLVQRAHDGWTSAGGYAVAEGREADAEALARRAVELLRAPQPEGGPRTVVLNQQLGGVFAHEAFGHLSEADFLYENPKMRELMRLGRPMGTGELNIIDDGSLGGLIGTHRYDDEGTPTRRTYLIRDGVLAGHLHSLETAGKMGAAATGNARAHGRTDVPIVRMTNTYIAPGRRSFAELIADVDDGLYACDAFGGETMMEMFTFSAAYAYRIRRGQIGELVRDVVLTGNVFETLGRMDGFGDDLVIREAAGGCGKGGQGPLPVSFGAPHLRIRDVIVGGR